MAQALVVALEPAQGPVVALAQALLLIWDQGRGHSRLHNSRPMDHQHGIWRISTRGYFTEPTRRNPNPETRREATPLGTKHRRRGVGR